MENQSTKKELWLSPLTKKAYDYLEISKEKLPKQQQDILAWEEKYKNSPVPTQFEIEDTRWGWGVYIIKNNKVQDYKKEIIKIIDTFYYHLKPEITNTIYDEEAQLLLEEAMNERKNMIMEAILEHIHDFQIDKLIRDCRNGKDKYNCAPKEIISINRWEKTDIRHRLSPIDDMNVINRASLSSSADKSVYGIHVSKDVFSPRNGLDIWEKYSPDLMWSKTKKDLLDTLEKKETK